MSRTLQRVPCTKCRRRNDPWRTFCGACGSALEGACHACGAVNQPADKFCGGCARSLAKARPPAPIPKPVTHTIPITVLDVVSETSS